MIGSTKISQTYCRISTYWSGSVRWPDCCSVVTGTNCLPEDPWLFL